MTVTLIEVPSYAGVTIRNTLFQRAGNTRLMVLLPGRGYTVAAPLLHYSFNIGWNHGYDVLQVSYGFHAAQSSLNVEDMPAIHQESVQAVTQALEAGAYAELVLVGKSLGTPIAAMLANQQPTATKALLLTPIQKCYQLVKATPTLAVIGPADRVYEGGMAVDTDIVTWKVYEGLDHSLEKPGDLAASLAILADIMQTCATFIVGV